MDAEMKLDVKIERLCCGSCEFWDPNFDLDKNLDGTGTCELWKRKENPGMWTACGENTIETDIDFGCVQFSPKAG